MKRDRTKTQAAEGIGAEALAPLVREVATPTKGKSAKGRGRPPRLTQQISDRICAGISRGLFIVQAARLAGVSPDAIEQWREKGEQGLEPYAGFVKAFEKAELEAEATLTKIWKDAAPEDWRAAKEFLAKRFPERWSDYASRRAVLGPEGVDINFGSGLSIQINLGDDDPPGRLPRRATIEVTATPAELDAMKKIAVDEV
jgi:hypothetical protein